MALREEPTLLKFWIDNFHMNNSNFQVESVAIFEYKIVFLCNYLLKSFNFPWCTKLFFISRNMNTITENNTNSAENVINHFHSTKSAKYEIVLHWIM